MSTRPALPSACARCGGLHSTAWPSLTRGLGGKCSLFIRHRCSDRRGSCKWCQRRPPGHSVALAMQGRVENVLGSGVGAVKAWGVCFPLCTHQQHLRMYAQVAVHLSGVLLASKSEP